MVPYSQPERQAVMDMSDYESQGFRADGALRRRAARDHAEVKAWQRAAAIKVLGVDTPGDRRAAAKAEAMARAAKTNALAFGLSQPLL